MKKLAVIIFTLFTLFLLIGCSSSQPQSTQTEAKNVEENQSRLLLAQPAPAFDWSLEREVLIQIYNARNTGVKTYSYVISPYTGNILDYCPSIGYPIPANTQLTNPERLHRFSYEGGGTTYPQPEPSGLYTSPSTAGTFVSCVDDFGDIAVRYMEENVRAYPSPMTMGPDGYLVPDGPTEFTINVDKKD